MNQRERELEGGDTPLDFGDEDGRSRDVSIQCNPVDMNLPRKT
jgi:hypothetical protein